MKTIFVIIFVLILASSIIFLKISQEKADKQLAECIGNSVMYSQTGCSHCKEQEDKFGENVKYLTIVNCLEEIDECIKFNITSTPTWIIKNKPYVGVLSLNKLKELTGC